MKKILLSLFVWLIWFISFCSALTINWSSSSFSAWTTKTTVKWYCYRITNTSYDIKFYDNNDNYLWNIWSQSNMFCNPVDWYVKNEDTITTYLYTYNITNFTWNCSNSDCPVCPTCPDPYTSLECQTEYNLIPISSVDSAYCENNNLCPVYTGEISTWYSTLFINDIRHESMPFIYVNIPEEFNWDYSTWINDFTIDIEWYNVDTEYIDWIIRTQNYKPSSEDFTNLVWLLAPYTKYLVFLLFVFVVWAWIKKPFKSKKL